MYRRSGAPRVSVRSQRKVGQQQQSKKPSRTVIGVSTVPLSSRFTHLADETAPRVAKKQQHQVTIVKTPQKKGKVQPVLHVGGGKKKMKAAVSTSTQIQQQQKKKLQQVAQNNRSKRQQVVSKHRKGLSLQEFKSKDSQPKKKSAVAQPNGGRGAGRGGRGARGGRGGRGGLGGRGGRGGVGAKPPTGEDLDMDMDKYWHEAGKGPDPKAAQLDRQMEEYWATKPTQDNVASTKTEAAPAADTTMES